MAKPKSHQDSALSIRFGDLDGSQEDDLMQRGTKDEMVDPLDVGRDPPLEDEEADPRAGDPFADDTLDEAVEELEDVSDEEEVDETEPGPTEDDDAPTLRAQLEAERRRVAEIERDREEARRELEESRKSAAEARSKRIDDDLLATRAALKAAIEDGDTDKQVELQDKLADLHAEKRAVPKAAAQPERRAEPDAPPRVNPQTPAAQAWVNGKAWINSQAHQQANRDLLRMAQTVSDLGFDPNQPAYYEELERHMKRMHPTLFKSAAATPPKRQPGKQAVGRVSRDDPPRATPSKTVKLAPSDLANMRRFGLDPENKEHLREYARGKVA